MLVGIVDYGAGNIQSVRQAIYFAGEDAVVVKTPEALVACDRLILPGVGAAGNALEKLKYGGLDEALTETVRVRGRPMLGICLGMQLLSSQLDEFGTHVGLNWLNGEVVNIRSLVDDPAIHVPHMGWNDIDVAPSAAHFFEKIRGKREFYFAHSNALQVNKPEIVAGTTYHGTTLTAMIHTETVFATQFHPEKSQVNGERLLAAFLKWSP